jgi:4-hydroxythreonine-4-phosphate dehydrogenase
MAAKKPIIGITMGDPAGIGPEISVKALSAHGIHEMCHPLVIGDPGVIEREMEKHSPGKRMMKVESIEDSSFSDEAVSVLDIGVSNLAGIRLGEVSSLAGEAAFRSVTRAIELAMNGKIDAVVTGPIHKKAIQEAGHHFPGHTEIFAEYTNTSDYAMLLLCNELKVIHVTTHVSLKDAIDLITKEGVLSRIRLMHTGLVKLGIKQPRIGVAGLNPHAGDEGLFGDEERKVIQPAVEQACREGYLAEGPVPADTLFPKALGKYYDGCVAMYHDQGHIPFKLAGFSWDEKKQTMKSVIGVNVTLGLPIIRASVDHGTAFDIAGKGIASEDALLDAIEYAVKMSVH